MWDGVRTKVGKIANEVEFIQDEDLPYILAQVESVQESMATVQITLQHLQGELHEGFQVLRGEMEAGREQASQEIRLLGF